MFNPQPKPEKTGPKAKKPLKRTRIKYRRKSTGEADVFASIWAERPHFSQVSGKWLGDEMKAGFFSHLLPKSHYKRMRLEKQNIVLKTEDEHHMWENQRWKLKDKPEWKWVFDLYDTLKQRYNSIQ